VIQAVNIITEDVSEALSHVAKESGVLSSKLYVQIQAITTFIKDKDSDFVEISNDNLAEYQEEEILRNEDIEFKQEYNIWIKPKDRDYLYHSPLKR